MDYVLGLPFRGILSWLIGERLLGLYIFSGIEVTGDLEINHLHVVVNCTHQLPHAGGVLFVNGTNLTLN